MEIHEFDPVIYPRKLWVAVSKDTFRDRFDGVCEFEDSCDAMVCGAHDKERNLGGILVRFSSWEAMKTSTIAHESCHVALDIFGYIGASVDSSHQEPYSYLVGWVADCISRVKEDRLREDRVKESRLREGQVRESRVRG